MNVLSSFLLLGPWIQAKTEVNPAELAQQIRAGGEVRWAEFQSELETNGIFLDRERGQIRFEASVNDPQMPIEYLIVGSRGASHESLFLTSIKPSLLTTALHLLGLKPGSNVQYRDKNPLPKDEEIAQGVLPYEVIPPQGDGVYLYAQWKQGEETRFYRVEDLLLNTKRGKTAARVPWIFLGSRMLQGPKKGEPEVFAADLEENFASICYFSAGNQILTNPDLDAQEQHLYFPNSWLLPEKGSKVNLLLSLKKLETPAEAPR